MKKHFVFRNIIIAIVGIIAIGILVVIILDNQKKEQEDKDKQIIEYYTEINEKYYEQNKAGIMINEVNAEGWIELFNDSEVFSLEGYSIWVNGQECKRFDADQSVSQNEYYIVESNMRMDSKEKNIVALKDKQSGIVDLCIIPMLSGQESYGYGETGTKTMTFVTASKGQSNENSQTKQKDGIVFSHASGFYDDDFLLSISAESDQYKIYYTTDGTAPSVDSKEYTEAIKITNKSGKNFTLAAQVAEGKVPETVVMGNVIRAIAVNQQGNVIAQKAATYYVGINQKSDIQDMPVVSIVTDSNNLFDYFNGIYILGRKYDDMVAMGLSTNNAGNMYESWTRPAYIEFFETNKDVSFYSDVEISVLKDYSLASPQKGFRIDGISESDCKGSFISQFVNDNYNTIALQTNKRDSLTKLREALANSLLETSEVGVMKFQQCLVFINGEYWGVYALRTPYDKKYFKDNYGIVDNNVLVTKSNDTDWIFDTEYSQIYNFIITQDMQNEAYYEYVKANIDIQSYLDYFCANIYVANPDYGRDEAYIWKTRDIKDSKYQDGRWRWVIGKLDFTMNAPYSNGVSTGKINTLLQASVRDDQMFRSLYNNAEFRDSFKMTMKKMGNEIFEIEKVNATLESLYEQTEKGAIASYQRFYGNIEKEQYKSEVDKIKVFFEIRNYYMERYVAEFDQVVEYWNNEVDLSEGINWGE